MARRRVGLALIIGVVVAVVAGLLRVALGVAVAVGETLCGLVVLLAFRGGRGGGELEP